MSETKSKDKQAPLPEAAKANARPAKKTYSKEVKERARKIEVARNNEKAKIASEERKVRMARRAEDKKKAEEMKKAKIAEKKDASAATNKSATTPKKVSAEVKKAEAESVDWVDFAVTARKYKTQLTRKYKERKFWVDPSPYEILSYIPGTIISVDVKEGKVVDEGTQLLVLEAMKMQNRIDMPFKARIKKINVKAGEKIPKDFLMIELEAVDK